MKVREKCGSKRGRILLLDFKNTGKDIVTKRENLLFYHFTKHNLVTALIGGFFQSDD